MRRQPRSRAALDSRFVAVALTIVLGVAVVARSPLVAHATGISSVSEYPAPGGDPWGTAFDAGGRVWVAMPGCDLAPSCPKTTKPGKLGLFDPNTSTWTVVVSLPAGFGQPLFPAVDRVGKVWFTMPVTNTIGVYDPASATVQQWAIPTASGGPWGITIDGGGKIWFTEHYVNKIGAFDPVSQTFQEVSTPATNSNPYGITTDAANNIWFTENNDAVAKIGEYTPQGTLNEYKIRNSSTAGTGLTPHQITVDGAGNVWWSEGWVSSIGKLNVGLAQPGTNAGVTEYHYTPACGSCGSHTSGIAADHTGLVWLDDALQNTFGSFPVGGGAFSFYASPSGGHPHDGLNVDAQNRVWYDEEFANKLAMATQSGTSTTTTTSSTTTTGSTTSTSTSTSVPGSTTSTSLPASGTVLGADTFLRPDQSGWGTASDGHAWGGDAGLSPVFSISGHVGRVANTGSASYSAVLGASATDSEVFATGAISSFSNSNFGDVLRWANGNNWYKAFVDGAQLFIQKKVGGVATMLGSTPFPAAAGTPYTIHFRVVGSTLSASVWPASASEPTTWMLSATDSSLTSGFAGLRFLTQAGTATITSFQAASL